MFRWVHITLSQVCCPECEPFILNPVGAVNEDNNFTADLLTCAFLSFNLSFPLHFFPSITCRHSPQPPSSTFPQQVFCFPPIMILVSEHNMCRYYCNLLFSHHVFFLPLLALVLAFSQQNKPCGFVRDALENAQQKHICKNHQFPTWRKRNVSFQMNDVSYSRSHPQRRFSSTSARLMMDFGNSELFCNERRRHSCFLTDAFTKETFSAG